MINRLPWRKKLRTSAANNLDKINEIIDYINHSDISPVALSESGSGRSVTVGTSSSLKSLDVHGESIQDGTPTPDAPVEVQVVEAPTGGQFGILIGDTVTPIDLQGNVLASLPDGTHDRLLVDSAGHKTIDNAVGHIASYNDETVGDIWLSNTGQLTTGADVYYKLATPQTIDLGYIDMPTIESGDAISVSANIVPVIDAAWWSYDDVTDIVRDLKAYVDYKTADSQEPTAGLDMSRPDNISLDTQVNQPAIVEESEMI